MSILLFRIIIMYLLVFSVIRLTGKRQLSQLQPFDFVITLLIADLASMPMEDPSIPLSYGIVPIAVLFLVQKLVAHLALKSKALRKLACGSPLVIVNRGKVMENTMRQANYTLEDLTEHLRTMSVFELSDVWYAILETNGSLSVMLRASEDGVKCKDIGIEKDEQEMSYMLVSDGEMIDSAMKDANKDKKWLAKQLRTVGITNVSQVFCAYTDKYGDLHIQTSEKSGSRMYSIKSSGGTK